MTEERQNRPNRVLLAVRLGWLTVEVFGRLRAYLQSSRRRKPGPPDASRRFDFSDRSLTLRQAIFMAVGQLRYAAEGWGPEVPPLPLPPDDELEQELDGGLDLDALGEVLNKWSTQVWIALSAEDDVTGRAFTYGGSLADTYWYAAALGPEQFSRLLRRQRLEYIAQRFDSIADRLPSYTAGVLHHTLYKWRDEGQIEALSTEDRKKVLRRLESQVKVWHDMLFGGRSAESYLTRQDRLGVTWGSLAATVALIVAAMVLVWLAVLILSSAGRSVSASMLGVPEQLVQAQSNFVSSLLNWQTWSTLLATFSSLVVLLIGFVSRLSGWILEFHDRVRKWLKMRLLYRRTYRHWGV
jgi:hypothetical protein